MHGRDVLLFNVSEPDDALRRELCAGEFVHVYPSRAQLMDGLAQYVVSRKWTNLLEFQGPTAADAAVTAAFLLLCAGACGYLLKKTPPARLRSHRALSVAAAAASDRQHRSRAGSVALDLGP